jgi:hypothetical protein
MECEGAKLGVGDSLFWAQVFSFTDEQRPSAFLKDLVATARGKRVRWQLVVCGPRNAAFDAFTISLRQNPDAFVDAEAVVETTPWVHLYTRDHWSPGRTTDDHCQLMTQAMESWLIADIEALASFYGENFIDTAFLAHPTSS